MKGLITLYGEEFDSLVDAFAYDWATQILANKLGIERKQVVKDNADLLEDVYGEIDLILRSDMDYGREIVDEKVDDIIEERSKAE